MPYLDHNATSPIRPAAMAAMAEALARTGNPSSAHAAGRAARGLIEQARRAVATAAGADPAQVIFTSGGSEANALALNRHPGGRGGRVLASAIEHASVLEALPQGGPALIPVTGDGVLDLAALERMLAEGEGVETLVAVMLANNETGVIQPVAEVVRLAHAHGARVHCDAVQAAGRIALDFAALGADTLALSAHKIGGPAGAGALIAREPATLAPLVRGGGQERRLRPGTENLAGIAGFGAAAAEIPDALATVPRIARLRDRLEDAIRTHAPEAVIHGRAAPRLANTSCIGLGGVEAMEQVILLDLAGFAVSAGAACSSGTVRASHVIAAMAGERAAHTAIRVSTGRETTSAEIDAFFEAWWAMRAQLLVLPSVAAA